MDNKIGEINKNVLEIAGTAAAPSPIEGKVPFFSLIEGNGAFWQKKVQKIDIFHKRQAGTSAGIYADFLYDIA